ncbi:NAD(P)/FAD-dependent oxidoreductase [Salipiger sp. PrR002]|uniref:NAD(P)/FAD-dependent oxidoreductase n=1 Tax=Salipiger sp. PrR002 TaxID=2706489 RepID=UPI0034CF2816
MSTSISNTSVGIIGGGPAGLTAAYELQKLGPEYRPLVLEAGGRVGGIARTENHKGFRFDIGGHRFFTKIPEVQAIWQEVLGDDFITVPRLSRIYYRDAFYDYPLKLSNALSNLGIIEAAWIGASYLRWRILPNRREDTFEEWVINRFGKRLYTHFFKTYTEKVWGVPCTEIRSDWAAQRVKDLSLSKALWQALGGASNVTSLIEEFQYPRLGPGMLWERMAGKIGAANGEVRLKSYVNAVNHDGRRVTSIDVATEREDGSVRAYEMKADHFINSMALRDLLNCMNPAPPPDVLAAARRLKYRDFLVVTLVLDHADPFPDNWIYVHSDDVRVGRIQNFRAWSDEMVPEPDRASIGMEFFCNDDDDFWAKSDAELIELAAQELEKIHLAPASSVIDGVVIRQPKSYPVYDSEYSDALAVVRDWLSGFENFQTVGRNGLHRYNNQDHSMLSAVYAARNIAGATYDVWGINVDRAYHEEFQTKPYEGRTDTGADYAHGAGRKVAAEKPAEHQSLGPVVTQSGRDEEPIEAQAT